MPTGKEVEPEESLQGGAPVVAISHNLLVKFFTKRNPRAEKKKQRRNK